MITLSLRSALRAGVHKSFKLVIYVMTLMTVSKSTYSSELHCPLTGLMVMICPLWICLQFVFVFFKIVEELLLTKSKKVLQVK